MAQYKNENGGNQIFKMWSLHLRLQWSVESKLRVKGLGVTGLV